jgi:hypothetical protein
VKRPEHRSESDGAAKELIDAETAKSQATFDERYGK